MSPVIIYPRCHRGGGTMSPFAYLSVFSATVRVVRSPSPSLSLESTVRMFATVSSSSASLVTLIMTLIVVVGIAGALSPLATPSETVTITS